MLCSSAETERNDKKLEKTSKRGIFVGYEDVTRNYCVWIPEETRIEISQDVDFREVIVPETLIDLSQEKKKKICYKKTRFNKDACKEKIKNKRIKRK